MSTDQAWMPTTWFNTYPSDGDGLTRTVVTTVDLATVPLVEWSDEELGFRLAVLYPQVDGYGAQTARDSVQTEVRELLAEIKRRGYDPFSNLRLNEQNTGWGWLPGFTSRDGASAQSEASNHEEGHHG